MDIVTQLREFGGKFHVSPDFIAVNHKKLREIAGGEPFFEWRLDKTELPKMFGINVLLHNDFDDNEIGLFFKIDLDSALCKFNQMPSFPFFEVPRIVRNLNLVSHVFNGSDIKTAIPSDIEFLKISREIVMVYKNYLDRLQWVTMGKSPKIYAEIKMALEREYRSMTLAQKGMDLSGEYARN